MLTRKDNQMSVDWFKTNGLSLVIAIVGVISAYIVNIALYGARLDVLEKTTIPAVEARQDRQGTAITNLQSGNQDVNIALARIQVDIEYIKVTLNKIVK